MVLAFVPAAPGSAGASAATEARRGVKTDGVVGGRPSAGEERGRYASSGKTPRGTRRSRKARLFSGMSRPS